MRDEGSQLLKIAALSDLHGCLPADMPECDLLLLGGDLTPLSNHNPVYQAEWLDTTFRYWLRQLPARKIIGIAGNHDFVFEQIPQLVPRDLPWTYLQDSGTVWEGWRIWGTPWQPWFFDWAFNGDERLLQRKWALIPRDTDILVVHGPPYGYGDGVPEGEGKVRRCGCRHLLARIETIKPKLVVFGHIHEGRGQWQIGPSLVVNASLQDGGYRPVHPPWVGELERISRDHDA